MQALSAHIPIGPSVDRIADGHVVGRHALGDGASGTADPEKPSCNFLSRTNFSESAVLGGVQIHLQSFLVRPNALTISHSHDISHTQLIGFWGAFFRVVAEA